MIRRVALAVLSLALCFGAAEIALRHFDPVAYRAPRAAAASDAWRERIHVPSTIPGLTYEPGPLRTGEGQATRVSTNAQGLRGPALQASGDELFRIAVLGDSFTFGFGVDASETYPAQLQEILRKRGPAGWRYEVLNFGVGGYSARDEALYLEHKALPLEPDLVIVGYVLNDPESEPIQPLHAYFAPVAWWQHSHLLRLVAGTAFTRDVERLGDGDYYRYLHADSRKWQSVVDAFASMRAATDRAQIPLLLAIFPGGEHLRWQRYPYRALHAQVVAAARAARIPVIDLLAAFASYPPERTRIGPHDDHPSILGHALAAHALYDALASQSLLPPEKETAQ